ncbi:response regulator transcription factor [Geitlerinema splendidum]|nr:response regulator transcription factor [Geitlerinema splendidum]
MNTLRAISTLLVDDEPRFRRGLRTLLDFYNTNSNWQFEITGEAASVEQAVKLATEQHPTLILLDLELPPSDGINALLCLKQVSYKGKVLVLSAHREDEWIFRAMQAGASGYLFKDCLATQFCEAIQTIMNDEIYLAPAVATAFFRLFHFYSGRSLQACQAVHLTEREQEVLHWLVQGASNEEIASKLYITVATVKAHLTAIFEKLNVNSRTQAIVKALKLGLVCA